ncbi:MAG: HD domain-containing protein [Lachnospiraceae bacterium]|nr:HD domain-containing protein [Lachnospiraceae bacterium]
MIIPFCVYAKEVENEGEKNENGSAAAMWDEGNRAGYTSVLYDSSSGLPTSEANCITQTPDGFIWIGSYSGLIRYDGNSFYRYDATSGISSVVSLFVDSKRRLWIGTNDSGVAVLSDGEFKFWGRVEGLKSSSIRAIQEDSDGNILLATTEGLAYVDNEDVLHAIDDPQLNTEYVCRLDKGTDGTICGVTLAGGIFTVNNLNVGTYYNSGSLGMGKVYSITADSANPGYVYIGTDNSEIYHGDLNNDLKGYETLDASPLVNINTMAFKDDLLWVCADNGIGYFDENRKFTTLSSTPMDNSVDDIHFDYENNVWFASSRQGVMKIVGSRFVDIFNMAGLPAAVVNSTCKYDNCLYIGTDSGLIILDDGFKTVENTLTETLDGVRIRCVKADTNGNVWLSTYSEHGLVKYNKDGSIKEFNEDIGINSNRVRSTLELSDKSICVATSGGVNIIDNDKVTASYGTDDGINNTEILSTVEGGDGSLYLGSDGDGIYAIKGTRISRLGADDGLKSEVILRLKKDPLDSGIIWIITSNSIAYLKDGTITTVEGFPYSNNFDLYFDNEGYYCWVLASNGIYKVAREDLLANADIDYALYATDSGLPSVATANSRSFLDSDGTLYIAGSSGVSAVNINSSDEKLGNVKLSVPSVEVDGVNHMIKNGQVMIPSGAKRVIINSYALSFSLNDPLISTWLEGFEENPELLRKKEMKPQTYTNLQGGEYTYHLAILDDRTGARSNEISVRIIKKKAIYEYLGFKIFIGLVFVGFFIMITYLIMRRKNQALLKKEKEDKALIHQLSIAFGKCIDMKDPYTKGHSFRVAKYTRWIAEKMGISGNECEKYYNIALLHDIGKISIPDNILNKQDKLNDEEYELMKSHPQKGAEMLEEIKIMPEWSLGAGGHHEKYDGTGYPKGLKGDEIPLVAQIISVADTFDAMYSTRPYREKQPLETVVNEIKRVSGTQLNPVIVDAFYELYKEGKFDNE